ncbi:MAG TPA: sigma-54 dependent transcriptional regulator [Spirochaetia bacterium]|nr:sigma-54 dependent transcriptional regulator [Spirochaetia bacterium]
MPDGRILIIDDEVDVGHFFKRLLQKKYSVSVAVNGAQVQQLIKDNTFDVAMVDLKLPDTDGLSLLRQIKTAQPACEVIIMTGYSTTRTAVKAIQLGAYDYIEKPFDDIAKVEELIGRAASYGSCHGQPADEEWSSAAEKAGFRVGSSAAMRWLASVAYKIAAKDINVLIQGETGTGKEVLARFIHAASNRVGSVFIPVNCGALPENLLESELFGHEKGAFTGANNMRRGFFEMANHGTLFLDEIGEATSAIQVKLLRVLETGEFLRIGGETSINVDVRVIAATNVDLDQAVREKAFREDLFYRLDVVRLDLPPLRVHREDIPMLAEYVLQKIDPSMHVSVEALQMMSAYSWPGNVRELANSISQAAALCDGHIIGPGQLSSKFHTCWPVPPYGTAGAGCPPTRSGLPSGAYRQELLPVLEQLENDPGWLERADGPELNRLLALLRRLEPMVSENMKEKGIRIEAEPPALEEIEARVIAEALRYYDGNITVAAKKLGMGRNTLYRRIKDYHLKGR